MAAIFSLLSVSASAEVINYVGSSTVGKFIADADKIYPHASFNINVESESLGGEQCAVIASCELGGVDSFVDDLLVLTDLDDDTSR